MKTSQRGKALITAFEGVRLTRYKDSAGLWTIGVGHLIRHDENFTQISPEKAQELLAADLVSAENCINSLGVELNQNRFDALVCWCYNVGCGAVKSSTLVKKLRAGDFDGAAKELLRWDKVDQKSIPGLKNRRNAEMELFLAPCNNDAQV